jgi:putative transposase
MLPGKPTDNACIEPFNWRVRDEYLKTLHFLLLARTGTVIEAWRRDYNEQRLHCSLAGLTPNDAAAQHEAHLTAAAV